MTSPEPTASVAAFSALAMAITLFLFAAQTAGRALTYRRAECLQQNSLPSTKGVVAGRCVGGQPGNGAPASFPAERRLHLAAHLHGERVFVVVDVAPAQALALRDLPPEPSLQGQPQPP